MRALKKATYSCIVWCLFLILGIAGVVSWTSTIFSTSVPQIPELSESKSWGYQLQNIDLEKLNQAEHDVLVIDYSSKGDEDNEFSTLDISRLKTNPDGSRRIVLAYLSIGEAEEYRFYWEEDWGRNPPSWLDEMNPDWPTNYLVRYWDPDWQSLILDEPDGYLHRIMSVGFDGVYLDRVDSYQAWADRIAGADQLMHNFVRRLVAEGRKRHPNFLIVQQNAEALLVDRKHRGLIDAVGKEDLVYGLAGDAVRNQPKSIASSVAFLNELRDQGKPVFVVEYGLSSEHHSCVRSEIAALGYIPLFAERTLSNSPQPHIKSVDRSQCSTGEKGDGGDHLRRVVDAGERPRSETQ